MIVDVVASVTTMDAKGTTLVVTVGPSWHRDVKQNRLVAAQTLAKLWASMSPAGGAARIKLVDQAGNEVGGTGLLGGVDVSD